MPVIIQLYCPPCSGTTEETAVFGREIEPGERATESQLRRDPEPRNDFYPLHINPAAVLGLKNKVDGVNQRGLNQPLDAAVEIDRFQRKPLSPEGLFKPHVPFTTLFRP